MVRQPQLQEERLPSGAARHRLTRVATSPAVGEEADVVVVVVVVVVSFNAPY